MRKITEGDMPFKGYKTHYRVVEGTDPAKVPLILLHGGPGSTHVTLEVLDCLADCGRTLVYYDQIGCGESWVEPGHPELYNKETWCEELSALIKHLGLKRYNLLGHSWGGMLAITYVSDCALPGLNSVVLSSTLPSSKLWGEETHRLIGLMDEKDREAIRKAEETGDWSSPEAKEADQRFMRLHVGGPWTENDPECLRRPKKIGHEAYVTAWGPNEYTPSGNLADWDYLDKMKGWDVPTLITDGAEDESTPYIDLQMHKAVKGSQWEIFRNSRHMSYAEEHDRYVRIVGDFLAQHD